MQENRQHLKDRHLGPPAEANQDHHINFPKVEEESASTIADFHNTSTDRQKEWKQGVEQGGEMREKGNNTREENVIRRSEEEDDTFGH